MAEVMVGMNSSELIFGENLEVTSLWAGKNLKVFPQTYILYSPGLLKPAVQLTP